MSQESGVPTFREAQVGLWSRYNPEDLATPMAFAREPDLVWSWYMHRVHRLAEVNPNPGHIAVATMEEFIPHVVVITQNVDGLHERAGSTDILELHGRLGRYKCFAACQGDSTFVDLALIPHDDDHAPQCPNCGAAVRPDVVWYSEALPSGALHRAIAEASQCDVMLVIGTSGLVQPAASLPEIARQSKAFVIEINPVSGLLTSRVNLFLQGKSGALLPELVERIQTLVGGTS
jgi:NAD-dependent deacetylase